MTICDEIPKNDAEDIKNPEAAVVESGGYEFTLDNEGVIMSRPKSTEEWHIDNCIPDPKDQTRLISEHRWEMRSGKNYIPDEILAAATPDLYANQVGYAIERIDIKGGPACKDLTFTGTEETSHMSITYGITRGGHLVVKEYSYSINETSWAKVPDRIEVRQNYEGKWFVFIYPWNDVRHSNVAIRLSETAVALWEDIPEACGEAQNYFRKKLGPNKMKELTALKSKIDESIVEVDEQLPVFQNGVEILRNKIQNNEWDWNGQEKTLRLRFYGVQQDGEDNVRKLHKAVDRQRETLLPLTNGMGLEHSFDPYKGRGKYGFSCRTTNPARVAAIMMDVRECEEVILPDAETLVGKTINDIGRGPDYYRLGLDSTIVYAATDDLSHVSYNKDGEPQVGAWEAVVLNKRGYKTRVPVRYDAQKNELFIYYEVFPDHAGYDMESSG